MLGESPGLVWPHRWSWEGLFRVPPASAQNASPRKQPKRKGRLVRSFRQRVTGRGFRSQCEGSGGSGSDTPGQGT